MSDIDDELLAQVEREVQAERDAAQAILDELKRKDAVAVERAAKASDEHHRLLDLAEKATARSKSKVTPEKIATANRALVSAMSAVQGMGQALQRARATVEHLDDPSEVTRRYTAVVKERMKRSEYRDTRKQRKAESLAKVAARVAKLNGKEGHDVAAAATKTPREKHTLTKATIERIVRMVRDEGLGITEASNKLNESGTKPPGSSAKWYPVTIHKVVLDATGKKVSELRKKKPLASRSAQDRPPAPAKRSTPAAAKANGNGSKKEAKPISKSAQASGTTRGGTGSKRKSAGAKTSQARRGSRRSGR